MPPSSSNPYPISDQKKKFSTPVFRLGLQNPYPFSDLAFRQKLCYHYVVVRAQTKNYSNPLLIQIFLFLSYSFGIETIDTLIHCVVPSKTNNPIPDQNGQSVYPFSD